MLLLVVAGVGSVGPAGGATVQPQVFVSQTGSDSTCARNKPSRPCASFNRAYHLASCGGVVSVAGGTYDPQEIDRDPTKLSCGVNVVFQPAAGQTVTVNGKLSFGNGATGARGPAHVTVKSFAVTDSTEAFTGADGVKWVNLQGGAFYIRGAQNLTISGGDWGPCNSSPIGKPGDACGEPAKIESNTNSGEALTKNITINGATFHDFYITRDGDHFECFDVWGGTNITVENSKFFTCEIYDISVAPAAGCTADPLPGLVIQNNWFGQAQNQGGQPRISAVELDTRCGNLSTTVIRHNSFVSGQGISWEAGPDGGGASVTGNIFGISGHGNCIPNVTFHGNLWPGSPCGDAANTTTPFGYVLGPDGRLKVDVRPGASVQQIFKQSAAGSSLSALVRILRRGHYVAPGRAWSGTAVLGILANRSYVGGTFGAPGAQPALVSASVWQKACARAIRCPSRVPAPR
jgi:hypothetical protein